MRMYDIWHNGSRDHTVQLVETPIVGSLVRTNAYFNYRIRGIEYISGSDNIRLIAEREF